MSEDECLPSTSRTGQNWMSVLERTERDAVQGLRTVPISIMNRKSRGHFVTNNLVRPSFSLTDNFDGIITFNEWRKWDVFSRFYLERFNNSPNLYQCLFDTSRTGDTLETNRFDVYRIHGQVNYANGRPAFLLVQYICEHRNFTPEQRFLYRLRGEISFQRPENLEGYRHLNDYLRQGPSYFRRVRSQFETIQAFRRRGLKKASKSDITNHEISFAGDKLIFDILKDKGLILEELEET